MNRCVEGYFVVVLFSCNYKAFARCLDQMKKEVCLPSLNFYTKVAIILSN